MIQSPVIQNFSSGLVALSHDTKLFLSELFAHSLFTGFLGGCIITIFIVGFVLSGNPANVPAILKYSPSEGFEKIANRAPNNTYEQSYSVYKKNHTRVRVCMFLAIISFCVMVSAILFTK